MFLWVGRSHRLLEVVPSHIRDGSRQETEGEPEREPMRDSGRARENQGENQKKSQREPARARENQKKSQREPGGEPGSLREMTYEMQYDVM